MGTTELVPGWGAYLGPLCGDTDDVEAAVETRSAAEQVIVTVSLRAARDYARYGVESAPYELWTAVTEALDTHPGLRDGRTGQ